MKRIKMGIMAVILVFTFVSLPAKASDSTSQASIFFTSGPFIFEQAPSIDFGTQQLKGKTYDYKAQTIINSAVLADARGTLSGWSLKANLTTFVSGAGTVDLQGSVMVITPSTPVQMGVLAKTPSGSPVSVEIIPGDGLDHTVWVAKQGEGAGRWNMGLKTDNVVLRVPGHTATLGEHKAKMRWTLLDAPG